MQQTNADFAIHALTVQFTEANLYLRDATRRVEEHVRFYMTGVTALAGAAALLCAANTPALSPKPVLTVAAFGVFVFGILTYLRLISIKTQATQHYAWKQGVEYSLLLRVFGREGIPFAAPAAACGPKVPFSTSVVLILTGFAVCNGLAFGASVSGILNILAASVGIPVIQVGQVAFLYQSTEVCVLSGLAACAVALVVQHWYLHKSLGNVQAEWQKVLDAATYPPARPQDDPDRKSIADCFAEGI